MEKQGAVGDLHRKSKEELQELLSRQEKILHNKKFILSLPDKGKKISAFADRIRHALASKEQLERAQLDRASVWTDFQVRYQQAFTQQQRHHQDSHRTPATGPSPGCRDRQPTGGAQNGPEKLPEASPAAGAEQDTDTDLVEALQRVALSDQQDPGEDAAGGSPSLHSHPKSKNYYTAVQEKADSHVRTGRFQPNQLKSSSSPRHVSPLSSEARRQRDRKHLDDITAAKLPPLHHSPALMLSLEESITLQHQHNHKQQELQAQLAAQKLEGVVVSMDTYNPEGGALTSYREVHDDQAASDED